jgi:SAM-dependent methyltransferase
VPHGYNERVPRLLCPACQVEIGVLSDEYRCLACGSSGRLDGVFSVPARQRLDPGSSRETLREMNRLAEEHGWRTAIERVLPGEVPAAVDTQRADYLCLLDLPPEASILDLGDDWGNTASMLAGFFAEVTVVHDEIGHARYIAIRARQERLPVATICSDYLRMPLAPGQFDAVVLNRSLHDCVPNGERDSRDLQLALLQAAYRALKPSGVICATAENRMGWHRLRKKSRRREGCNPSALSTAGYRTLLRDAGYERVRVLQTWNGIGGPSVILPLDSCRALVHFAGIYDCPLPKYYALLAAAYSGLWARCAPELILMAWKT